jgi:two-component system, response regulator PdtaR
MTLRHARSEGSWVMDDETIKLSKRVAAQVHSVLIVESWAPSAKFLTERVRDIAKAHIHVADSNEQALKAARQIEPQVIFIDQGAKAVDGVAFARALRRGEMGCRKCPVIMTTSEPTASAILAARDAGVHEILSKPYANRDLLRRLASVILRPRDWIEAVSYVGPDRRRFDAGNHMGPLLRSTDPIQAPGARIYQALRIVRAAVTALDADPAQALRALRVQTADLMAIAPLAGEPILAAAAARFHDYLDQIADLNALDYDQTRAMTRPLIALLPKEDPSRMPLQMAS